MVNDRVQRGIKYLNKYIPGWYNHIDTGTLNIGKGDDCVLGQICKKRYAWLMTHFSGYTNLANYLQKKVRDFDAVDIGLYPITREEAEALTKCWKSEIEKLQEPFVVNEDELPLLDSSRYQEVVLC